jgi:outer membrane protein insertion porin family
MINMNFQIKSKHYFFFFLFLCSTLFAQQEKNADVYKILGISVEGNVTTDAGAIIAASGLKQGNEIALPGEETNKAIKQLWNRRIFSDVQIVIDNKIGDGVYLLIKVKEYPRMGGIDINGNDEIKTDKIKEKIPIVIGQVITPQDMREVERRTIKLYEEDGYLLAKVKTELVTSEATPNRPTLKITINEGTDVRVEQILFTGNANFSDGKLKGQLDDTEEKKWWKFWKSAKFDRKKYVDDKKKLVDFYRKNGYRDAEIISDSIWYDDSKEKMFIQLNLSEGPIYYFRKITWEGNTIYSDTILNERIGIREGELYNADKLDKNLRQNEQQSDVSSLYMDIGYLGFFIQPEETPIGTDSIDINFKILERNQFRIGHIFIKGNTVTQDRVIRRELFSYPGDIFKRSALIESMRRLQQLNYFNPEKIKPDVLPSNDSTVDITFEVEEKSSSQLNAQVGYSGYYGMVGSLGFTFTNFCLYDPLNGGGGQQLDFSWQFGESSRYQVFSLGFTEPWLYDTPTLVGFQISDTRYNYGVEQRTTGISARVGRRFKWPDDFFQGNWGVTFRKFDVISDPYGYYGKTGKFTQFGINQTITRNSKDSPIFPTTGSEATFLFELYGGPFPGNSDYVKSALTFEWVTPLMKVGTANKLALFLHSEFGVIEEIKENTFIDYYETYRMGGGGLTVATIPLRGYEDQSIGPKNSTSSYPSGKTEAKYSAELRYSVSMDPIPIHLLAFVEAGNVWKDLMHTDPFSLYRSAGIGVRLMINPIGLVGFDYGYGFDNPSYIPGQGSPSGWHFHFQFGKGM